MFNAINRHIFPSHGRGRRFNPYSAHQECAANQRICETALRTTSHNFAERCTNTNANPCGIRAFRSRSVPLMCGVIFILAAVGTVLLFTPAFPLGVLILILAAVMFCTDPSQ